MSAWTRSGCNGSVLVRGVVSEASIVGDLAEPAPAPIEAAALDVWHRIAHGYDADEIAVTRDVERLEYVAVCLGRCSEEAAAEPLVDPGQQHQERRHARVDVPVGDRPARLIHVCPALVGLRIAPQVGSSIGQAQDQ